MDSDGLADSEEESSLIFPPSDKRSELIHLPEDENDFDLQSLKMDAPSSETDEIASPQKRMSGARMNHMFRDRKWKRMMSSNRMNHMFRDQKRMMSSDKMNHMFRDKKLMSGSRMNHMFRDQKRMMSHSRMNHLFRDRRGGMMMQGLSKRYAKKGSIPPWVRGWVFDHTDWLDHMTRRNNDNEMSGAYN